MNEVDGYRVEPLSPRDVANIRCPGREAQRLVQRLLVHVVPLPPGPSRACWLRLVREPVSFICTLGPPRPDAPTMFCPFGQCSDVHRSRRFIVGAMDAGSVSRVVEESVSSGCEVGLRQSHDVAHPAALLRIAPGRDICVHRARCRSSHPAPTLTPAARRQRQAARPSADNRLRGGHLEEIRPIDATPQSDLQPVTVFKRILVVQARTVNDTTRAFRQDSPAPWGDDQSS